MQRNVSVIREVWKQTAQSCLVCLTGCDTSNVSTKYVSSSNLKIIQPVLRWQCQLVYKNAYVGKRISFSSATPRTTPWDVFAYPSFSTPPTPISTYRITKIPCRRVKHWDSRPAVTQLYTYQKKTKKKWSVLHGTRTFLIVLVINQLDAQNLVL